MDSKSFNKHKKKYSTYSIDTLLQQYTIVKNNIEKDAILYVLYDFYETTPSIRNKISNFIDSIEIDEILDNFIPYPEYNNKNFNNIIYRKKEFNTNQLLLDTSTINNQCNTDFSIKPHQSFLKNFLTKETPYKSLLIFHGVGVGKTCSALTIGENFRDLYARENKKIIILSSKNIQIGWKNTIYSPLKKENQCTGDAFTNSEATTEREINKLIKQYYELMAYLSFSNFVKRMVETSNKYIPEDQHSINEQKC